MTSTKAIERFPMFSGNNYSKSEAKSNNGDMFSQFLDMTSSSNVNNTSSSNVSLVNMSKGNIKSYDTDSSGVEDKIFSKDNTVKKDKEVYKSDDYCDDKVRKSDDCKNDEVIAESDNYKDDNKVVTKEDDTVVNDTNEESLDKKILKVSKELKDKLCEILDISEEELNELLADSQLTILSLFNQDSLMQFAMLVSGTDNMSQILTDENALNVLQAVTQAVNEIDVEQLTGISKEEFAQLVTDVLDGNYRTQTVDALNSTDKLLDNVNGENKTVVENVVNPEIVDEDNVLVEENIDKSQGEGKEDGQVEGEASQSKTSMTIEVEKGTSNNQNNSSKNNDANAALDAFTQNLASAINQTITTNEVNFAGQIAHVREVKQVIDQIVTQIKVTVTKDSQSIQMQLNPENLGRVNMTITSKNGVMTAQFIVESQTAKEAIEGQMKLLIENLNDQGLKVENLEVTTREFGFNQQESSQSQSQQNSKAKKSFKTDFFTEDTSQTEETEVILQGNNTVSYLA